MRVDGNSSRPSERKRFSMMVLPTVPSVSVAPMTAIVLGSSIRRTGTTPPYRKAPQFVRRASGGGRGRCELRE